MKSRFRLKLSIIMIVFAMVISITVALIDHTRLKNEVKQNEQFHIEQIEDVVEYSLRTLEKAYFLFEDETAKKMKSSSNFLVDMYEEQPNFDEWDFLELKRKLEFDIYIINEDLVITHSSFPDDIGLDFTVCCQKLSRVLESRRQSGDFFEDGMDIEQQTGLVKKYSYMATWDQKHLIQLGYSLQDGPIFREFNFLETIENIEMRYPSIDNINVLNIGGNSLGIPVEEARLTSERRKIFELTLSTQTITEWRNEKGEDTTVHRYIPYTSKFDLGTTRNKVIEIVYNENNLQSVLAENKRKFYIQLFVVLFIAVGIALFIAKWLAKPMHLAFHDSLTGLKNRAAFNEYFRTSLEGKKGPLALVLLDLDNFKKVNDYYGHNKGDELLKDVARTMNSFAGKEDITARLGGDEFVMIFNFTSRKEIEKTAQNIINAVREKCEEIDLKGERVTVSIEIALTPEHGIDPVELYKKADTALYDSKSKGKNQYCIFGHG
ncbi:hypothetical protein BTR23_14935 [Alkalihalophilus pseudofirmus]|nr:hypothetical protein BTR23_14935 [Alkalihalophilus pseudofirmus]